MVCLWRVMSTGQGISKKDNRGQRKVISSITIFGIHGKKANINRRERERETEAYQGRRKGRENEKEREQRACEW